MADTRFVGNKNVDVWWINEGDYVDANSPTATEINTSGIRVTEAMAWDGTTFPAATDSEEQSDLGLWDDANATTRGVANFDAVMNYFKPKNINETTTDYGKVYNEFRKMGLRGILVTRISQLVTTGVIKAATAGDWISVYKSITDGFSLDVEGDDSYKYAITHLPQGFVRINTQVKNASPVTVTRKSAAGAVNPGDKIVLWATLGGHYATQVVEWSVDDPSIGTVSQNGVVTIADDAAAEAELVVTAAHPAASASGTHTITLAA